MTTRSQRKTIVFNHPFRLKEIERVLPAGNYEVVSEDELIEGLSFTAFRRVFTAIIVPTQSQRASSVEMVTIDPRTLQVAQDLDAATNQLPAAEAKTTGSRS